MIRLALLWAVGCADLLPAASQPFSSSAFGDSGQGRPFSNNNQQSPFSAPFQTSSSLLPQLDDSNQFGSAQNPFSSPQTSSFPGHSDSTRGGSFPFPSHGDNSQQQPWFNQQQQTKPSTPQQEQQQLQSFHFPQQQSSSPFLGGFQGSHSDQRQQPFPQGQQQQQGPFQHLQQGSNPPDLLHGFSSDNEDSSSYSGTGFSTRYWGNFWKRGNDNQPPFFGFFSTNPDSSSYSGSHTSSFPPQATRNGDNQPPFSGLSSNDPYSSSYSGSGSPFSDSRDHTSSFPPPQATRYWGDFWKRGNADNKSPFSGA